MRIINSEIIEQTPQIDGRISVTERHTYDTGSIQTHGYLAPADFDLQFVAEQRAAKINAELERRDLELAEANNFEAPITQREFISLIPVADRVTLRGLRETNGVLNEAIKYLELPGPVYKSVAQSWLDSLVTAGVFSQSLVDSIMSDWSTLYG